MRVIKELRDFNPATLGSTPKAMKIWKMKEKQAEKLEEEAQAMQAQFASLAEDGALGVPALPGLPSHWASLLRIHLPLRIS